MSTETNKQTVLAFFAAMGRNDVETMGKLMTDDATWWVVPGTKFSGLWPKADYLSNIGLLYEIAAGPLEMDFREITAEDDRVAIVATKDRTVQPEVERFVAKRMSATTTEIESSHVPMLSNPNPSLT